MTNKCVKTGARVLELSTSLLWVGALFYFYDTGWRLLGIPTNCAQPYDLQIHGIPDAAFRSLGVEPRPSAEHWSDSANDLTICMISSDFLDHLEEYYPSLVEDGLVGSI